MTYVSRGREMVYIILKPRDKNIYQIYVLHKPRVDEISLLFMFVCSISVHYPKDIYPRCSLFSAEWIRLARTLEAVLKDSQLTFSKNTILDFIRPSVNLYKKTFLERTFLLYNTHHMGL